MAVNTTHPEYDANLAVWLRARDVLAGEDAVKVGGEKYLPKLEIQSDEEYAAYLARAAFFNATARTADGFLGLVFRRAPFVKIPGDEKTGTNATNGTNEGKRSGGNGSSALGKAMTAFVNDADMLGTSLANYAKNVVKEVIAVGRAGTLIDWEAENENRVYASLYAAENILNWRMERIHGRNLVTLVVLAETVSQRSQDRGQGADEHDEFEDTVVDQVRVLRLAHKSGNAQPSFAEAMEAGERIPTGLDYQYQVEIWRPKKKAGKEEKAQWELIETRVPLRLGKPLPLIPFVFHGARNFLPSVDKVPLGDVIAVNLDHYRLDADYKHGMHFTALPTAWVSGFDPNSVLKIGSSVAWTTGTVGATAGFLEYTGQGLTTFERAMDRDERQMAILGARLLETQKRVGETAEAIELRQSGENSVLGNLAQSVGASLTQVLRWAYWWNSTEEWPDDIGRDQVAMELNTDFSTKGLSAQEVTAVVQAWQSGALSRESMMELFRRGEVLPEGRTNEEEAGLIQKSEDRGQGTGVRDQGTGDRVPAKNANEAASWKA
jgi:hypothetical protein